MAGITGLGTTFNLPNYVGELFSLSPETTPLLSAIGGLTGGKKADATTFEWQTDDLRDAAQRTRVEGADAPAFEERTRSNVQNVVEIHQEAAAVSYTKQSTTGQTTSAGVSSASQPITNELDYQVEKKIKEIARDVEFSFINGQYQKPANNSTARKTRGILQAIQTNVVTIAPQNVGTGLSTATDTITEATTPVANDDKVIFTDIGAATGIVQNRVYYVVQKATGSFKVASTKGGTAITLGTATVSYSRPAVAAPSTSTYLDLVQQVWDNGGLAESEYATFLLGSSQKRNLSKAIAASYGQYTETNRNVGGINFTTFETDFGTFNTMLDRFMPADTLAVVSLEQLSPVFLEVPGKGHFFEEPLAKTGAQDKVQIYGEIGLEYGNELAHGKLVGLPV